MTISSVSLKENLASSTITLKKADSCEELAQKVAFKSLSLSSISAEPSPRHSPTIQRVMDSFNPRTFDGKFLMASARSSPVPSGSSKLSNEKS